MLRAFISISYFCSIFSQLSLASSVSDSPQIIPTSPLPEANLSSVTSLHPRGKVRSWSQNDVAKALSSLSRLELQNLLLAASEKSNDVYAMIKKHATSFGQVGYGPVTLTEADRIGFIRFRKVASTTFSRFLIKSGFCVGECEFQTCLYRKYHCDKRFECEENDPAYPCTHLGPAAIYNNFIRDRTKSLENPAGNGIPPALGGQLHLVTVLRNPTDRILSEFFYCQTAHPSLNWHQIHSPAVHEVVKSNNLENYIALGNRNPGLNRMTLQLASKSFTDEWNEDVYDVSNATLTEAIKWLHRCRLVLLAEYVPQSLALFRYTFGGSDPDGLTFRQMQAQVKRKSHPNGLREQWAANTTLMQSLSAAAWADHLLYQEARKLFFDAFASMLKAQGKQVSLEEGLALYEVTEKDVHLSWEHSPEPRAKVDL